MSAATFDYSERSAAAPAPAVLAHTWYLTGRKLHALVRQPWVMAFTVIQPVIWLFLFGALFHKVIDIPGFAYGGSYLAYLVPGIVAMNAMSGNMWAGMSMIEEVERTGDAEGYVASVLDRGERLMGFGHRVYRAEDPRARVLRRTAKALDAPRVEVAEALEVAALAELEARRPDRVLATNVEFWSAVVLDFAEVPPELFTSMFTCARTAGWSAHILEQKRDRRLVRPTARYVGPAPRPLSELAG